MCNEILTNEELLEIARYTLQKIKAYPESCKKDTSYFEALFPCEVKDYLMRRKINRLGEINRQRRQENDR